MLQLPARAKVNLSLHITGKRADGFHLLQSLVVFADCGDVVSVEAADLLSLSITGEFSAKLQADVMHNHVLKAAHLLQQKSGCDLGARISLEKNIPVGAGLGGGSADAAAALMALQTLWQTDADLAALAETIGSDVKACLESKPLWMEGVGERVAPVLAFPTLALALVNPNVMVATPEVYGNFHGNFSAPQSLPLGWDSAADLLAYLESQQNDLQPAALHIAPVISDVLGALEQSGASIARMSGSGATCFGIYSSMQLAKQAVEKIKYTHPSWWAVATVVQGSGNGKTQ